MLFDPCQSFNRAIVVRIVDTPRKNNFQTHHTISHHHRRHPCTHVNKFLALTWLGVGFAFGFRFGRVSSITEQRSIRQSLSTYLFLFDAFMSSQQAFRLISTRSIWVYVRVFGYQNCLINTVNGGNWRQHSEYRIHISLLLLIVSLFRHFIAWLILAATTIRISDTVSQCWAQHFWFRFWAHENLYIFGISSNTNIRTHLTLFSNW